MPDLLLELFSEEIPARFQRRAADGLRTAVTNAMVDAGLTYESAGAFVTPRRLALNVTGIPARSADTRTERKGPRTDAPEKAIEGFLRAAGLGSVDEAQVQSDPKKGDFYVAIIEKAGEDAPTILARLLPGIVTGFSWPKSMRWGDGQVNWVRPLRSIVATFGAEGADAEVIRFEVDGLQSGDTTFGHRFLAPEPTRVKHYNDYATVLEKAHVMLDSARRAETILTDARQLAFAQGLDLIEDEGLLEEVAGLVEWPVLLMGSFEEDFLDIPEEVIIATIRANQKCFCLRDAKTGRLANRFIVAANMITSDGGDTVVAGNGRVIRARLSDAKFFYDSDLESRLEDRLGKLNDMVFHQKLGTQGARVKRLEELAANYADRIGADDKAARRAAKLAKADLVTQMVFEFPELQGVMGRYYAAAQGETAEVAEAISAHYSPVGPADDVPSGLVSIAVALADKLDILSGFWAIDEKPTGSKDPYALRRAALGVIRILIENNLSLALSDLVSEARLGHVEQVPLPVAGRDYDGPDAVKTFDRQRLDDLISFFHDRLKVSLRDSGARHDIVEAAILPGADDLLRISQKVSALADFVGTEDGEKLLGGYRRATSILAAEEKKDGKRYDGDPDLSGIDVPQANTLATAVVLGDEAVSSAIAEADFEEAMRQLAGLAEPVDAFFEAVLVNDPDEKKRTAYLNLLGRLRTTMHLVADFSKLEG